MRQERVVLFFWVLLCFYFGIGAWRLGLGSIRMPGPGFLPFWISVIVIFFTLVQLLKTKPVEGLQPLFRGKKIRNTIYTLSFLFAYPLLFERMGFFMCTLLFTGACLKVIGGRRWLLVVGISLFVAIASYTLFVVWLQIQFPRGRWIEPILVRIGGPLWK